MQIQGLCEITHVEKNSFEDDTQLHYGVHARFMPLRKPFVARAVKNIRIFDQMNEHNIHNSTALAPRFA